MGMSFGEWLRVGAAMACLGSVLWLLAERAVDLPAVLRSAAWGPRGVDRMRAHLAWTAVRSGARGRAWAVEASEAAGRHPLRAAGAAGSGRVHDRHAGLG